jgi:hypothetical protein
MKRLLPFGAAALGLLSLAATSRAQTQITSIQFTDSSNVLDSDPTSGPGTAAGELSESYWNSAVLTGDIVYNSNSPYPAPTVAYNNAENDGGLVDSTGTNYSPVGYSITDGGNAGNPNDNLAGGNQALLSDGGATYGTSSGATLGNNPGGTRSQGSNLYAAPVTLTLQNLTASDVYSFYVYLAEPHDLAQGSLSLSSGGLPGATQYFTTANGGYDEPNQGGGYTTLVSKTSPTDIGAANPTNAGVAETFASNYVLFTGVTGVTSETITLTELGSYPYGNYVLAGQPAAYNNSFGNAILGIAGVQVVDVVGVPEPSTGWMVALGAVGLGVFLRRRCATAV